MNGVFTAESDLDFIVVAKDDGDIPLTKEEIEVSLEVARRVADWAAASTSA